MAVVSLNNRRTFRPAIDAASNNAFLSVFVKKLGTCKMHKRKIHSLGRCLVTKDRNGDKLVWLVFQTKQLD